MIVIRELADIFAIHEHRRRDPHGLDPQPAPRDPGRARRRHIATLPFKVLQQMVHHPLTDKGIVQFKADWAKASARPRPPRVRATAPARRRGSAAGSGQLGSALRRELRVEPAAAAITSARTRRIDWPGPNRRPCPLTTTPTRATYAHRVPTRTSAADLIPRETPRPSARSLGRPSSRR